ncbi:VOC family protein [Asanoa sp. NPDC049573]|uniref:VOC family protein n=1 Tax=Asanoa sp. NPDC049573 TaxID=3155396 RepID=UPI00341E9759
MNVRDWRVLDTGPAAWFEAASLTAGAVLVGRIAELVDGVGVLDLDLRPGGVRVRLNRADPVLARSMSVAARDLGLAADPAVLQNVRLVIDAGDRPSVGSFWQTVLGYEPVGARVGAGDDGLGDPLRRDPMVSFRDGVRRAPRDRIHVDVVRTPDAVDAARAAIGGAPSGPYGVRLADHDGNEVDLVPGDRLTDGPETADWRVLFGAMTFYPTGSPRRAAQLASAVAGLADEAGLPLSVDLRPDGVTIDGGKDLWEDPAGGAIPGFVDLAGRIQLAARDLGLAADPTRLRFVQFGIDAVDVAAVRAFWTSALGYGHDPRPDVTDIVDPRRLNPVLFFQEMDGSDPERRRHRNRVHIELVVPHDASQAHVAAAVAAGGRVVGEDAPDRRTVADPEGNELDIVWCDN